MQVSVDITIVWTFAVTMSSIMSILICGITLQPKYARMVLFLGYVATFLSGFVVSFLVYSSDIQNDFGGIVISSVLIWGACVLLNREHWSSKLFVAIMATLISNVSTFFICGPILSFIDSTPNPYNIKTISIFIGLKAILFTLLFIFYKIKVRDTMCRVIETLSGKMAGYLPVAIATFFGFFIINFITNRMGIIPAAVTVSDLYSVMTMPHDIEIRYIFIVIYGVISLIFVFVYLQIISSVFWSSRALKTETELNIASKIQQDMLPCIFPAYPDHNEFDIYASMQPAKEVGGDFYDFFLIDDRTLAVVIADVSDKGVPAALFMVIAKTLIKNSALSNKSPKEVFETVNNMLCENNEACMFVTAFLGYLDLPSGRFTYTNAGHNLPLLRSGSERRFDWLNAIPGFVLAGMGGMSYNQHEITLQPGDELFLYTDGVTEALNSKNKMFSEHRLLETANQYLDLPLKEFIVSIKQEIDKFTNGVKQSDDITMLALRSKHSSNP